MGKVERSFEKSGRWFKFRWLKFRWFREVGPVGWAGRFGLVWPGRF